jgi:hypothetical protein
MTEHTPIFQQIQPNLQFHIFGDLMLFLTEVVESDLLSLGRVFFINFSGSNVKGVDNCTQKGCCL